MHIPAPRFALSLVGQITDGLAHFGWKAPRRSTSLNMLMTDIQGEATDLPLIVPAFWIDPLASLITVFPSIILAAVTHIGSERQ